MDVKTLCSTDLQIYPRTHAKAIIHNGGTDTEEKLKRDCLLEHLSLKTVNNQSIIGSRDLEIKGEKGDPGADAQHTSLQIPMYGYLGNDSQGIVNQKTITDSIQELADSVTTNSLLNANITVYSIPEQKDFVLHLTRYYNYNGTILTEGGNAHTWVFKTCHHQLAGFFLYSASRAILFDGFNEDGTLINASQYTNWAPFTTKYIMKTANNTWGPRILYCNGYGNSRQGLFYRDAMKRYELEELQKLDNAKYKEELEKAANDLTSNKTMNLDNHTSSTFPVFDDIKKYSTQYYPEHSTKSYNSLTNSSEFPYPARAVHLKIFRSLYSFCCRAEYLDCSHFDTSGVTQFVGTFAYCFMLKKVNIVGWNFGSITGLLALMDMFNGCGKLTSLIGDHTLREVLDGLSVFDGLKQGTTWAKFPNTLERASLRAIINGLADVSNKSTQTILIGSTLKAKLTADDIAVATRKNWTIS